MGGARVSDGGEGEDEELQNEDEVEVYVDGGEDWSGYAADRPGADDGRARRVHLLVKPAEGEGGLN